MRSTSAEVGREKRMIQTIDGMRRSADRQAALAAQIEAINGQMSALERAAVAERAASRAQNELQAMQVWGPDHASRPPAAVLDMRGPIMKLKSVRMQM
jgi:hypothetical protein